MAVNINIPSQVKNYANLAAFPASGSLKTIYIAEDTNKTYRWTGSVYVEISASAAMTWGQIGGTLSNQTDLQTALNAKQDSLGFTAVPTTRTLTINGTTQDLSADRTFTISTGITIGTTAITSGTVGRVLFEGTGNVVQESSGLTWDNTNRIFKVATGTNGIVLEGDAGGYPTFKINTLRSGTDRRNWMFATEQINIGDFVFFRSATGGGNASTLVYSIFNDGNFGLNTSTNAGFKLDVNGTARVSGNLTFGFNTTYITTSSTGGGINAGINTFFNNGAIWIDDTSVRALDITYNNGIKIANTTRYPLSLGTSSKAVASAQLEMVSTTQGFLPPRMTNAQRTAIVSPAVGLIVYCTDVTEGLWVFKSTGWTFIV